MIRHLHSGKHTKYFHIRGLWKSCSPSVFARNYFKEGKCLIVLSQPLQRKGGDFTDTYQLLYLHALKDLGTVSSLELLPVGIQLKCSIQEISTGKQKHFCCSSSHCAMFSHVLVFLGCCLICSTCLPMLVYLFDSSVHYTLLIFDAFSVLT